MQSNYHSHCSFCDGSAPMEDFVRAAVERNIKYYGFSSHSPVPFDNDWSMKMEMLDEYRQEFFRLKEKYETEINLSLGMEVDFISNVTGANDEYIRSRKWDYLISSIHHLEQFANGEFWNIDHTFAIFKDGVDDIFGGDISVATKAFYRSTCEMIELGGFDIIGHVDKITMNGRKIAGFDLSLKWYDDLIQEVFRLLAEKEIMVEINTKIFSATGITFPDIRYFKQLHQLNIPVTVNSDCHSPEKITDGFPEVYKLLKENGFKTTRLLIGGRWEDVPIVI